VNIKIIFFISVMTQSVTVFCSDSETERTPIILRKPIKTMRSKASECLYGTVIIGCPVVLTIAGAAVGVACYWAEPHACMNFPIPKKSDQDFDAFWANMVLSPVILGLAGTAVGALCSLALWKLQVSRESAARILQ
jgi:hypothetical protein